MKSAGIVMVAGCVLTLATWVAFAQFLPEAPLDVASTTAVLCAWLLIVTLAKLSTEFLAAFGKKWRLLLVLLIVVAI